MILAPLTLCDVVPLLAAVALVVFAVCLAVALASDPDPLKTARVAREDSANVDAGSAVGGSSGCNPVGGRVQLHPGVAPRAVDARAVVHPVHGIVPTVAKRRSTDPAAMECYLCQRPLETSGDGRCWECVQACRDGEL